MPSSWNDKFCAGQGLGRIQACARNTRMWLGPSPRRLNRHGHTLMKTALIIVRHGRIGSVS